METTLVFATLTARPLLLTAATATFALLAVHPTLAKSLGADVWNVPALNKQLREAAGENDRLDAADDEVRRRIALKEALVTELIAGRAALADVTEKFVELNASRPEYLDLIRTSYPGETDYEKTARNVISYALSRVPVDDRDALSLRLDAELRQATALSGAH